MRGLVEEIEKTKEEAEELEKKVHNYLERFDETALELKDDLTKKKEELSSKLRKVNNEIEDLRCKFLEKAHILKRISSSAISLVDDFSDELSKILYGILIGAIFLFIILVVMIENGILIPFDEILPFTKSLNPILLNWLVLLLSLLAVTALVLNIFDKRLKERRDPLVRTLGEFDSTKSELKSRNFDLEVSYSDIDKTLHSLISRGKKIISGVRAFIPAINKYSECRVIQYKQKLFVDSLYNCLFNLGISINDESREIMENFGSLSAENEWVREISKPLARKLLLSPEIIQLIYYEYTNKIEELKNIWLKIRKNERTLRELAHIITNYRLRKEGAEEIVLRILKNQEIFNLKNLETTFYEFYVNFQKVKEQFVASMNAYNFDVPDELKDFLPKSKDKEEWVRELCTYMANQLGIKPDLVQLIFYEFTGEYGKRQRIWNKVRNNVELLSGFVKILRSKKLLPHHGYYEMSDNYDEFISQFLLAQSDFVLIDFRRDLIRKLQELDEIKRTFFQSLHSFNLKFSENLRNLFNLFLPKNIDSPLDEVITFASKSLALDEDLLQLLYLTYINEEVKRKETFLKIKNEGKTQELANLLVNNQIIKTSDKNLTQIVEEVSEILLSLEDFVVGDVQRLYERYKQIISESRSLCQYLREVIPIKKEIHISLPSLIKILSGKENLPFYNQMKLVCSEILNKGLITTSKLSNKEKDEIVVACLALYFNSSRSIYTREACKEASTGEIASKILYQYVKELGERKLEEGKVHLRSVIKGVIENKYEDYKYLNDFREKLSGGYLYTNINELLRARFEDIEKSLIKGKQRLENILQKCKKAVRDFLKAELKPDFLVELLNSQVISAYMITTTSPKPVLRKVIDSTMPKICEELGKENPIFKDFLILAEEARSMAGRYTRIGLVPRNMSFDEFSKKFNEIFSKAVIREVRNEIEAREYSVNLIRIFPSDLAFKLVKAGIKEEKIEKGHPVFTIKQLCIDRWGLTENLELVASSKSGESTKVVLRKVIESLFNQKTNLLLLTKDLIFNVIKNRRIIKEKMEREEFDQSLMREMGCSNLSELAIKIRNKHISISEETAFTDLKESIKRILKSYNVRMRDRDINIFAKAIFQILDEIGLVLEGLE